MSTDPSSRASTDAARWVLDFNEPGRLVPHVNEALRARPGQGRSGWSRASHLRRDVERVIGRTVPRQAIDTALAMLISRGLARSWAAPDGLLWFCPVGVPGTAPVPLHLFDGGASPTPRRP
jgi:hypothetical protein